LKDVSEDAFFAHCMARITLALCPGLRNLHAPGLFCRLLPQISAMQVIFYFKLVVSELLLTHKRQNHKIQTTNPKQEASIFSASLKPLVIDV